MCGCVCACLSLPVVCCWAIWQLPSTPNCRIMQQTCVNLASTNKNWAQLSIFGVNLSQIASTNKKTPFSILEQTCLNCKHKHLEHPIIQFCNKALSQSASVHMSSANAEAGEQTWVIELCFVEFEITASVLQGSFLDVVVLDPSWELL
jgi:hypothetical protein